MLILAYAGTYFLGIEPLSYMLQKFAFAGLAIVLLYSSRKYEAETTS